ncbi:MAG: RidA family protein [Candidatus Tectomicrobia bacterium]|uniref:RidA family protein n=1 Tax=Tectimicrobiota bacterium TaxID=2528274 RepID=A0A933GJV1_UNCTE|nr:RidA family protein [Candidatus Tectomicrobia bacterium]
MDEKSVVIPKGMESYYQRFHFAPAVKDGNHLYCSGVIGTGADGKPPADPEMQFTQAFESLQSVLKTAGVSFSEVIEMTTFHVGLQAHLPVFMKVKDRYMQAPYPAWTAIGISELALPGGLVEIKVIARLSS